MKNIKDITKGGIFGELCAARTRLQGVQRVVDEVLAAHDIGAGACRADTFSDEDLRLVAASPAVAVHVRQVLPTLQERLNSSGYAVRRCRVSVALA